MDIKEKFEDIDPAFEEHVKKAVTLTEREQIRAYLNGLEEEFQSEAGSRNNSSGTATVRPLVSRRWLQLAASLLLIAAAFFVFQSYSSQSSTDIVADYYEPYPNGYKPITRSQVQEINIELHGLIKYESEQYKEALSYFNQLPNANDDIIMFKAISKMELEDLNGAKTDLQTLIDKKSKLSRTAQWYMGILLVKEGAVEQAKKYFEVLANQPSDSSYQRDASELLGKL